MCGLFGWVSYERHLGSSEIAAAQQAVASLNHRGPDARGEWIDDLVYMGHRRLSIIDISEESNQPFHDQTGRYVLSYNGEVYNYVELRKELEAQGYRFRTQSDTEVVLVALIAWGETALRRFDGMFALAFHDRHTRTHLIARDPLGQKPMYYAGGPAGVIYASELGSLLKLNYAESWGWTRRLDRSAFRTYLMFGYYPRDMTPVSGIKKLLPGTVMRIESGQIVQTRYWDSVPGDGISPRSMNDAIDEFDELFDRSCHQSMRSDVPYGVFLSGGIDSSLVVQSCQSVNSVIQSYCLAMSEADFDESQKASAVARHLGLANARTFVMDERAVRDGIADCFARMDEPHGDPGLVNAYVLSRAARPFITVALAGDGGDELFAGYAPFAGLAGVSLFDAMPDSIIDGLRRAARLVPGGDGYVDLRFKLNAYLQGFPAADCDRFALWLSALPRDEFHRATGESVEALFAFVRDLMMPVAGRSRQQQLLYFYQKVFLPEFVCLHTDRAAMWNSLEVRSPFLSVPLIEFANRLSDSIRMPRGTLKAVPKASLLRRGLPSRIVHQRKQGFTFPLARWLKNDLRSVMDDLLDPAGFDRGLIGMDVVASLRTGHLAGHNNNYRALYNLMAFQAWRRRFPSVSSG